VSKSDIRLLLSVCIGCDVLEKDEDVVGQTRDQRRACGARGRRDRVSLQAFALAIVVHHTLSESCMIAVSEADREINTNCVGRELYWWVFTPSPAPIRARFRVSWSAWQKRCTATQLQISCQQR
jgi:hypothetical protein